MFAMLVVPFAVALLFVAVCAAYPPPKPRALVAAVPVPMPTAVPRLSRHVPRFDVPLSLSPSAQSWRAGQRRRVWAARARAVAGPLSIALGVVGVVGAAALTLVASLTTAPMVAGALGL